MEQTYVLSPCEDESDTRTLLYRYGNFVYGGPVITEPVRGLEYLPGVLAGIQAVQGQVPYQSEVRDLAADSPYAAALIALQRAADAVHAALEALTDDIARVAAAEGNEWVDGDGPTYFEFEALPGYDCCVRVCGARRAVARRGTARSARGAVGAAWCDAARVPKLTPSRALLPLPARARR